MARGQTTNEKALAKQKSKELREIALAREDLAEVLGTPAGRRFMYRMIYDTCGLQNVYLAQDSGIYKHEGSRKVGADLARTLQMEHTEAYILMITERMRDLKYSAQVRDEPKPEEEGDPE